MQYTDRRLFLLMVLPWSVFLFFLLEKCCYPLSLLVLLPEIEIGEGMTVIPFGWDRLNCGMLVCALSYGLFGDLCGIFIRPVNRR